MAQTGFTPIQLYSTSTATAAPAAGNLTNSTLGSELAINITDGKLFYKDNANAVQVIGWKTVPTTAGGTGLTTYTAGDLSYYASGTTFTKLAIGTAGQILTSTGSAPQWTTLSGVAVTTFSAGTTGFTPNSATSGAITLAGTLAVGNGGTGTTTAFTAGSVVFAGASGVYSQDNANLFWDDANNRLGIGIATPAYPFHVSGGSNQILGFYKNTDATNVSYITVRDKDDLYLNLGRVSSSACFIGYADALRFQQGATLHGLFDASGNFAVGTSTTGFNSAGLPLVVGSGSGNTGMTIFSGNASSGSIHFADGTSGSDSFRGFINYNHSTNSMQFGADAGEDMRIHSSGGVSIGNTTDPGATNLSVNGVIKIGTNQAVNGPAFSVYSNAAQTLGSSTWTKITFGAEEYDTNSNFASSTFTPTVAGYYQINGSLNVNSSQTQIVVSVYKNGSPYKNGANINGLLSYNNVNCQVYLNGTTDYVEIYGFVTVGQSTGNDQTQTYFQGCMMRGA